MSEACLEAFFAFTGVEEGAGPLLRSGGLPYPDVQTTWDTRLEALHCELDATLAQCTRTVISAQDTLEKGSGVYALFHHAALVYIGSAENLRGRLKEHLRSIQSATKISTDEVFYKVVYCGRHISKSFEGRLIEHYAPRWNSTGFGSKANGNGRRHQRPSVWDETYGRTVKR